MDALDTLIVLKEVKVLSGIALTIVSNCNYRNYFFTVLSKSISLFISEPLTLKKEKRRTSKCGACQKSDYNKL